MTTRSAPTSAAAWPTGPASASCPTTRTRRGGELSEDADAGGVPASLASGGPRVVYLAGLGRSGSTLLERLLGELPGAWPAGEVVHLWLRGVRDDERCGCGAAFSGCPFWQRVGQLAFGGWDRVDLARVTRLRARVDRSRFLPLLASARLRRRLQPGLGEYAAYYRRTYAAVAAVSGRPVVIDSSKHVSLAFCLSGVAGLDLRVVQVVRDSRAVAYSWRQIVHRPEAAGSQMSTYPAASAAMRWDVQNGAVDRLPRLGVPTLRVRYEDFIADPARVLDRIAAFCGLAAGADQACLSTDGAGQWWADLGPAHTVSGNPMRFRTGRIPIRSDDRWRDAMRVADRRLVTALTLPLLARYGYLRVPRPAGSRPGGVTAARRGPA